MVERIANTCKGIWISVSATTRPPRPGEMDGTHYFFISDKRFDQLITDDGLLEWAAVHGSRYGTLRDEVVRRLDAGTDVILEIDPQGAFQVKGKMPEARLIFIMPPSMIELERRLCERGTESPEQIARRLQVAEVEIFAKERYNSVVINDDLDVATQELMEIIKSAREIPSDVEAKRSQGPCG